MSVLSQFFTRAFFRRPRQLSARERVEHRVRQYPYGVALPWGAISSIAAATDTSRSYAGRVAHEMGYWCKAKHIPTSDDA